MSSWFAYLAFRTVETFSRMLPTSVAWRVGAAFGWLCLWMSPYYRRLVTRNLTIAFGRELPPQEIRKLTRRHMMNLGGNFFAGMKMPYLKMEAVLRHLEVEGIEHVQEALAGGHGALGFKSLPRKRWGLQTKCGACRNTCEIRDSQKVYIGFFGIT